MSCDLPSAEAVFSYTWSSVLNTAAVGFVLVAVGIIFFKNKLPSAGQAFLSGRIAGLGALMILFGALALGIAVPDMYFVDRVALDQDEMCSSSGLWFMPPRPDRFYYSEVDHVLKKQDDKGLYELEVHFKDGKKTYVRRTDLWAEHEMQILQVLQHHGVALRE